MFSATGGVNTHKGLIFASAILCGALGKVYKDAFLLGKKPPVPLDAVVGECKKLGSCSLKDFKAEDRRQDVSAGAGSQTLPRGNGRRKDPHSLRHCRSPRRGCPGLSIGPHHRPSGLKGLAVPGLFP